MGLCVAAMAVWRSISSQKCGAGSQVSSLVLRMRTGGISCAVHIHSRFAVLFRTYPEHNTSEIRAMFLHLLTAKEVEVLWVYSHSNVKWDKECRVLECCAEPPGSPEALQKLLLSF